MILKLGPIILHNPLPAWNPPVKITDNSPDFIEVIYTVEDSLLNPNLLQSLFQHTKEDYEKNRFSTGIREYVSLILFLGDISNIAGKIRSQKKPTQIHV